MYMSPGTKVWLPLYGCLREVGIDTGCIETMITATKSRISLVYPSIHGIVIQFTRLSHRKTIPKELSRPFDDLSLTPNPNVNIFGLSVRRNPELFQPPSIDQLKPQSNTTTNSRSPFSTTSHPPQNVNQLVDSRQPLRRRLRSIRRLRSPRPQVSRHLRRKDRQLEHCRTLPSTSKRKTKQDPLHPRANNPDNSHQQLIHSVALVAVETAFPGKQKIWAKSLLTAGMTMFSGSIYLLVLDPQRFKAMGPITPLGGVALIGGWVALAVGSRGRIAMK